MSWSFLSSKIDQSSAFSRLAKVLLPVFLITASTSATPDSLVTSQFHVYVQTAPSSELRGVTPAHTIRLLDLSDEVSLNAAVDEALAATKGMPEQRRALLNFDFDFLALLKTASLATDLEGRDLAVLDSNTQTLPDQGIWLDSAMGDIAARVDTFFEKFASAGGELDLVALNYSGLDLSVASLTMVGEQLGGASAYFDAISSDPRFAAIADELGYSDLSVLLDDSEESLAHHNRWDAVMQQRIAAYLNTAFYLPIQAHFADAQVVANRYFAQNKQFSTKVMSQRFADTEGAVVGNAQANILPMVGDFDAFKASVDTVRSMVLASDKPVYPFIKGDALSDAGSTSWYQELILHSGLSTAGRFVYLNQSIADDESALLSSTISELTDQIESGELALSVDNQSILSKDFVLTKAKTDRGALWRFTPLLANGETIESVVTQSYPATVSVAGSTLSLADTQIVSLESTVADRGIWLESAEPAAVGNCASVAAVNDRCYAVFSGSLNSVSKAVLTLENSEALTVDESGNRQVLFERQWGAGGADAGLAQQDDFSIRYATSIPVAGGNYRFTVAADDKVRLWADGELIIDASVDASTASRELFADVNLSSGHHNLVLEYTDIADAAAVKLSLNRLLPSCEVSEGVACLSLLNASGEEVAVTQRVEQTANGLKFDFDTFELPEGIDSSQLTMRWEHVFDSEAGPHDFAVSQGAGSLKVWLDNQSLYEGSFTADVVRSKTLEAGPHRLRVELQPTTGSFFDISWTKRVNDCAVIPNNAFCGEFFENKALTGDPAKVQQSDRIDFDWGRSAPFEDFVSNNFSARWTGSFEFEAGSYTFRPVTDDGVRIWVDDRLVIDHWRGQSATERPGSIWLDAGRHVVKMEYYEGGGNASAKLSWSKAVEGCETVPQNKFCAEYYDNNTLIGSPVLRRNDAAIDFNWSKSAPDASLPVDYFSARWVGDFDFEGGDYNLGLSIDDGARVWVDGKKIFDSWNRGGNFAETFKVTAGQHRVIVEYREWAHGARAQINWKKSSPCEAIPENQFCGEFFDNTNLSGLPVHHVISDAINFDWKRLSPAPDSVPADRFTVRWQGDFDFAAGKYNFDTTTDDGVRVWVGDSDTPIIDSWNRGGNKHAELELAAGKYRIKVEYREWGGNAKAILKWTKGQFCDTIPKGEFCGEYFANNALEGFPVITKNTAHIDYDWRANSPEPGVVPKDKFSIRWQGDFDFAAGDYRFVSRGDDAMRVWLDDELVIDQPKYNGYKELFTDVTVPAGTHRVKVEMTENYGHARAKVFWEQKHDCSDIPSGAFCGSYFNNVNLSGEAVRTQLTDKINYSWKDTRPMHGVNNNRYSVRWLGKFDFNEGYYKFSGNVDDGIRLWVGDQQVLDQWSINSRFAGNVQATPWIPAGQHVVKVEYREHWSNAHASIDWEPVAECNTAPENAFCIELYGNRTLSKQPIVVKKVESISNDWERGQPDEMVWKDSFSARWTGKYNFEAGNYRFTTSTDDGVRLYIDGEAVINKWRYQGETAYEQVVTLDAGQHELQMEYFEGGGSAAAHLSWEPLVSCAETPKGQFCGDYFNNRDLSGIPVDSQLVDQVDFDWTNQAPNAFVNRDKFSARWKGRFDFEGGLYRFLTDFDDGMRVRIDGELIIDGWTRKWPYYGKLRQLHRISAGEHTVEVEYREHWGSAKAKLWWEQAPDCEVVPTNTFCAAFYAGTDLDENKLLDTRVDDEIDFNWGGGYPYEGANVPRDKFSVRWQGAFDFTEGEYTFNVRTDDGFRLWVGDDLLIDSWKPQGATSYAKRVVLDSGRHVVKAEYFESSGGAVAQVGWTLDQANQPKKPESLTATEILQNRAVLTWETEELVKEYRVLRDGQLLTTVTEGALTDQTVEVTKEHRYQIIARWANGRESEAATVKVSIPDTDIPTVPQSLRVADVSATNVSLVWDASTDNVAVAGYKVLRDGVEVGRATGNGAVDDGLTSYSQHRYQVVAFDAAGNESTVSNTLTVFTKDSVSPTVPGSVIAALNTEGQINLKWGAATDNVGVANYIVMRDGERLATITQTHYTDTTADENTRYQYQVLAQDNAGNESSPSLAVSVMSGDVTAPGAPGTLVANVTSSDAIALSWEPAVDNKAVVAYKILRDGRLLATSTIPRYTDTRIETGYQYAYAVKAVDAAGNVSLASNHVELGIRQICRSTEQVFETQLATTLAGSCATCHTAGGMAQTTRLILSNSDAANDANLQALNTLVQQLDKAHILNKASGVLSHGGGAALAPDSAELQVLDQVLAELVSPASCDDATPVHQSNILTDSLVNNCSSCHGTLGQSAGPATPTISGMKRTYIAKVMQDYQSGQRASTVMDRIAKGYTRDEIQRIAAALAEQPYVAAEQTVDAGLAAQGQTLHLENCASCHTSDGRSDFWTGTRLAGQWMPYLEQTLMDYAQGHSQGPAEMKTAVDAVFATEGTAGIKALAAFYASVQGDSEVPEIPDFVSVAAYTTDSITLTWMDSDDDWGVDHYEIYRDGTLVGTTRFNAFTDVGLSTGRYQYTVIAVDISGQKSVASEAITATLSTDSASPEGVVLLDYQATLRKSSLLLLGRLPTVDELASADTEEGFRQVLGDMMSLKGALDTFAYRAGHETFLSRGAANANGTGGIRADDFPILDTLTRAERSAVNTAIREEPIYLMQHILDQDRPWTEMLTADYTVVNPALANVFGVTLLEEDFIDNTDMSERRRAKINQLSARFADKAFPHAGVLTMNAWLSRFPTTDTNRNRHRSAKLFKQFLGVDIEALAQRPLDDSNNGDFRVPTMENPNCMTCHTVMDPVAGAFRNWGTDNRYARNFNGERGDKDSLSRSYKSSNYPMNHQGQSWYHQDDTWYRDMLMPGMNDKVMPGAYGEYGGDTLTESENLLENPSAESGITGWTMVSGEMESSNKETCERVTVDAQSGGSLFQLGQCTAAQETVLAIQEVDIDAHAADIDAGTVRVGFGAYFRSKQNRDTPSIWVSFLDGHGDVIAETDTLSDRRTWRWRNLTAGQTVPANTRRLRFNMKGQRSAYRWADAYVDAYVDDVYMQLYTPTQNVEASETSVDALQWLGQQMVQDSRFAKGSVYFWYRALFKREPLAVPVNPEADNYAAALAAYNEQDAILDALAKRFSRDNGQGAWNVKALLIDMVASPLFRAYEGQLSAEEQATLSDIGLSRLLTPEELNRKLKAVTGYEWRSFQETRAWSDRMGLFYGGFDGGRLQSNANTEMNSMMSKIPERMAIEMSCNMVYNEFRKEAPERGLLRFVEATDTPAYEDVSAMASNMLINPGAEDGMTGWVLETGEARILSGARGCNGGPSIKSGRAIFNPGGICSKTSALGRVYQDVDITAWADLVDQGVSRALFGAAMRSWSTNNDEASVYLVFRDESGNELGTSEVISSVKGVWSTSADFADVPAGTRVIRYVMQGRRLSTHANNDAFVDDTYLRLLLPDSDYMPAGERRIRENLQYLHQRFLNESLSLDDSELERTFNLFNDIWTERSETENMACRLYNEWEDPNYTKRAWTMVMMYLMTDARFLHE